MPYHRSEEHTSELQSHLNLVCRLLLEKKNTRTRGAWYRCSAVCVHVQWLVRAHSHQDCMLLRIALCPECLAVPDKGSLFFFFNDAAPTEFYPLSHRAALPI